MRLVPLVSLLALSTSVAHAGSSGLLMAYPNSTLSQCSTYKFYWTGGYGFPSFQVVPVSDYTSALIRLSTNDYVDTSYVRSYDWLVNYPEGTQLMLVGDYTEASKLMTVGPPKPGVTCELRGTNSTISNLVLYSNTTRCGTTFFNYTATREYGTFTYVTAPGYSGTGGADEDFTNDTRTIPIYGFPVGTQLIFSADDVYQDYGIRGLSSPLVTVQDSNKTCYDARFTYREGLNESWTSLVGQKFPVSTSISSTRATSSVATASASVASPGGSQEGLSTTVKAVIGAVVGVATLLGLVIALLLFRRRKRRRTASNMITPVDLGTDEPEVKTYNIQSQGYDLQPLLSSEGIPETTYPSVVTTQLPMPASQRKGRHTDVEVNATNQEAEESSVVAPSAGPSRLNNVLSMIDELDDRQRLALVASIAGPSNGATSEEESPPIYRES